MNSFCGLEVLSEISLIIVLIGFESVKSFTQPVREDQYIMH